MPSRAALDIAGVSQKRFGIGVVSLYSRLAVSEGSGITWTRSKR
jgi:hypothetical protein